MARSVKRVVLVLLAAAVLAFAAWMLWPRSLGGAFAFDQPFTLTVTELEMQEDGSWTVKEPVSSVLEPGDTGGRDCPGGAGGIFLPPVPLLSSRRPPCSYRRAERIFGQRLRREEGPSWLDCRKQQTGMR